MEGPAELEALEGADRREAWLNYGVALARVE